MNFIEGLNARFSFDTDAGVAEIIEGNGGLPAVTVKTREGVEGTVYLHGAHVAAWVPQGMRSGGGGEDILWLSGKSLWQGDKPIRGGVPVCFPWFGASRENSAAPAHGFARLRTWDLESLRQEGPVITVTLATQSDESTQKLWPGDFSLKHRISFGDELVMSLEITNTGGSVFTCEEAQHTYFAVGDIHQVRVTGLDGVGYIDKVDAGREKIQQGAVTIGGETDRVYLNVCGTSVIEDFAKRRKIIVTKENSRATVVWNPWVTKSKAMPDFGDEEWVGMLCVETCNVGGLQLRMEPGQTHIMTTRVGVERL